MIKEQIYFTTLSCNHNLFLSPNISKTITAYKENIKKLKEAEKELKVYDSFSKQDDKAQKLREEQDKYKLLLEKQKFEQERIKEDSANELEQIEINKLKESSEKVLHYDKWGSQIGGEPFQAFYND